MNRIVYVDRYDLEDTMMDEVTVQTILISKIQDARFTVPLKVITGDEVREIEKDDST